MRNRINSKACSFHSQTSYDNNSKDFLRKSFYNKNSKIPRSGISHDMKGLEPIIAVVVLIGIVMLAALIIYQWQGGFVQAYTNDIGDQTRMQLRCEKSDISIINASFDCGSCNLSLKLKNSGLVDLSVPKVYITNKADGIFEMNGTLLAVGDVKSISSTFANCASLKNAISEVRVLTECQGVSDFVRDVSYVRC